MSDQFVPSQQQKPHPSDDPADLHFQPRVGSWHTVHVVCEPGTKWAIVSDANGVLMLVCRHHYAVKWPGPIEIGPEHPQHVVRPPMDAALFQSNLRGPPREHAWTPSPFDLNRCRVCMLPVRNRLLVVAKRHDVAEPEKHWYELDDEPSAIAKRVELAGDPNVEMVGMHKVVYRTPEGE